LQDVKVTRPVLVSVSVLRGLSRPIFDGLGLGLDVCGLGLEVSGRVNIAGVSRHIRITWNVRTEVRLPVDKTVPETAVDYRKRTITQTVQSRVRRITSCADASSFLIRFRLAF